MNNIAAFLLMLCACCALSSQAFAIAGPFDPGPFDSETPEQTDAKDRVPSGI